jgi:hypothetical protein
MTTKRINSATYCFTKIIKIILKLNEIYNDYFGKVGKHILRNDSICQTTIRYIPADSNNHYKHFIYSRCILLIYIILLY